MPTLFFSYSHKDESWRDQLEVHLAMLVRQGTIEVWHDRRITAGSDLDESITEKMNNADIILLLASPDFLASDYCYDVEVQSAMARHNAGECRVIPVILRPCEWQEAPFGKLLAAPRDGKAISTWPIVDEAFLDVTRAIRNAVENQQNAEKTKHSSPGSGAQTGRAQEGTPGKILADVPRSSNTRLRQNFSDADRFKETESAFEYMCLFFENTLAEIDKRRPDFSTAFRRVDSNTMTATIFNNGSQVAQCQIELINQRGRAEIRYGENTVGSLRNGWNDCLTVEADAHSMYLSPQFAGVFGDSLDHLSKEGAAEHYWSKLVGPLQD